MPDAETTFETRPISSLVKIFADEPLAVPATSGGSALRNEVYSFQVAYYSDRLIKGIQIRVESALDEWTSVRSVGLAPSELPWRDGHDDDVLRTTPGLYPDPLYPIGEDGIVAFPEQWRAVWITIDPAAAGRGAKPYDSPGAYSMRVVFEVDGGAEIGRVEIGSCEHTLEIIDAELPPQKLIVTEWFHSDCIATYYGLEVFGEEHWRRIKEFIANAVRHGVNMILTPIFTPPLDTAVGGERPTVQLVEVEVEEEGEPVSARARDGSAATGAPGGFSPKRYRFSFDRLERWVEMCNRLGVEYFEFSHLFTQWGAEYCPKIVARVEGEERRIFGWDTPATGNEYRVFLDQFLPALVAFIRAHGLEKRSFFHVSDEPRLEQLEQYRRVRGMISGHLAGFPIMDALSNYEFYADGVVDLPIPASNHIEPFIEHGVKPLWTYYCVGQRIAVSNRFFSMPSARNRILGSQLYKFDVDGFLQWGYNFWYSRHSVRAVNPFANTDADYSFPSGDAFLVYPGENGPIDSLRFEVFREALQDLRALRLLELLVGRDRTLQVLEAGNDRGAASAAGPKDANATSADEVAGSDGEDTPISPAGREEVPAAPAGLPITFSRYPRSSEWLLAMRRRVNEAIKNARTGSTRTRP